MPASHEKSSEDDEKKFVIRVQLTVKYENGIRMGEKIDSRTGPERRKKRRKKLESLIQSAALFSPIYILLPRIAASFLRKILLRTRVLRFRETRSRIIFQLFSLRSGRAK